MGALVKIKHFKVKQPSLSMSPQNKCFFLLFEKVILRLTLDAKQIKNVIEHKQGESSTCFCLSEKTVISWK